jgi:methylglyoxal synthase
MPATVPIPARKRIALVAHDNCKAELIRWAREHRDALVAHDLLATGTTGGRLTDEVGLAVTRLLSGPLGGDLQIGARIAENAIDVLIFFWDPLEPQPHDPDIKALLRVAVLCNIPTACNRATADFLLTSPLIAQRYAR